MTKKDGDAAIAAAAGIAASKVIEAERRSDEVEILGDSIPEGERASKIFRMRFSRAKRPGQQPGGQIWCNAGDYPFVQGDTEWYEKMKVELVAKYGPGDYDGIPCDANKRVIEKAPHWTFKVLYDEAIQIGWIDPSVGTTGQPGQPVTVPTKDRVTEAKERVAVAQEELQLESLKKQLAELKSESSSSKKSESDPALVARLEEATRKVYEAEKQAELAKASAAHREELAKRDRDKADLESRLNQQQRDLDALKQKVTNPDKPAITPEQIGLAVTHAIDGTVGKALDKASGWAALLTPLVGALATKLATPAPAPAQPDVLAMINALKNTLQPPTTVDPMAMLNSMTSTFINVRKSVMPEDDGPDEEEILDRELRKFQRMKELTGGGKSTVAEIGDIANRTLKTIGDTVVGVAGARAGMPQEPQSEEDQARLAKKRRALARAKAQQQQQDQQRPQVVKDPDVKPTKVDQAATEAETGEPTAKDWASLAQGLTKALKAKANPVGVARALAKKFPKVAAELVVAPSIALVEIGLASVAGKMGRPYGVFVNELASELRKEEGKAWGEVLLAELKKILSGQGSQEPAGAPESAPTKES